MLVSCPVTERWLISIYDAGKWLKMVTVTSYWSRQITVVWESSRIAEKTGYHDTFGIRPLELPDAFFVQ